jgi:competence ComEA-like helix-hairpin-helix protein
MTFYTRRQIVVLLILLAIAGLGLAIGHWRRARPDAADYLEQLDRAPAPIPNLAVPRSEDGASSGPSPESEPRRSRRRKTSPESARPRNAPTGASPDAIDLNRATTVELTRLPGVGPALAQRIVDVRKADGPFTRIDELGRVRGMSARKVEKLRALLTVGE